MILTGRLIIDGVDAYSAYGLVRINRTDDFLKLPARKKAIETDFLDADGTITDTSANYYDGRTINIECVFLSANRADLWQKYQAMEAALTMPGLREIYIAQFGASVRCYYVQNPSLNRINNFASGQVGIQLTMQFKEVIPQVFRDVTALDLTIPVAAVKVTRLTIASGTLNLDGTGSYLKLGYTTGYAWAQVSGNSCTITSPSSSITSVTGLVQGQQYVFSLTITGNNGRTSIVQQAIYFPVNISGPKVTKFNFNKSKANGDLSSDASGWTGVHGNPDTDTISVTSAITGVTVSTNPTVWMQDMATTYTANNGAVTGANSGFAPDVILANYWMSENVNGSILNFSGFTPGATVYIDLIFGLSAAGETDAANQYNARYSLWSSAEFGLNPLLNTNVYLTMSGVAAVDGTKQLRMFGYSPLAHGITACIITEI